MANWAGGVQDQCANLGMVSPFSGIVLGTVNAVSAHWKLGNSNACSRLIGLASLRPAHVSSSLYCALSACQISHLFPLAPLRCIAHVHYQALRLMLL